MRPRSIGFAAMLLSILGALPVSAVPAGTAFTFQGYLQKDGTAYSGPADLEFRLYGESAGGAPVAGVASFVAQPVSQGLFTVSLDFGSAFDGDARWLEISVMTAGEESFTVIEPRVELQPVPYALHAPGAGGGGPGLPIEANIANPGQGVTPDALLGKAVIAVNNDAPGGVSHGVLGMTISTFQNAAGVVGVGAASSGYTSGVQGHAVGSPLGTGVVGLGNANGGYFRSELGGGNGVQGLSSGGNGLLGESTSGTGARGTSTSGFGLWGQSQSNVGVRGESSQWGVFGTSGAFSDGIGVFGLASSPNSSGVMGRNDTGNAFGQGVFGYSAGNALGVLAVSEGNDGLSCRTNASNKSAIFAYAGRASSYGGFFTGVPGSVALRADGLAEVRTLMILGGSDLAEPFDVAPAGASAAEPGTVVVIDAASPGDLRVSDEAYDSRVAGIISGANGLEPGMVMKAEGARHADGAHAVALTGRVWCKVDAGFGAVAPGDLLTTSPTPGHAMLAGDAARRGGAVIGKAMTSLERGRGLVLVLVNLQ